MMTLRRFLGAAVAACLLAPLPGSAQAADFGDAYGMDLPYIQGEVAVETLEPVRHQRRVLPPLHPPQDQAYYDGYPEPLPPRPAARCLSSQQVQSQLVAQGWRGFVNPQRGVDVVGLTARRPNGLTYRLKLDRCTGVILSSNLLDQPDTRRSYSYDQTDQPSY